MNEASIRAALDEVQPAFASDGFELRLNGVDVDGTVEVALVATDDACLECLVPDDILVSILHGAVQEKEPAAASVRLVKSGAFAKEAL